MLSLSVILFTLFSLSPSEAYRMPDSKPHKLNDARARNLLKESRGNFMAACVCACVCVSVSLCVVYEGYTVLSPCVHCMCFCSTHSFLRYCK